MRNNAPAFAAATLVLGVFAAFLRWLQTMNLYDPDTGLARVGAGLSAVLLLFALACAGVFLALALLWMRRCRCPEPAADALRAPGLLPLALAWVCAGVFVACALVLMFTAAASPMPRLRRALGAAAIFGGLCFPFLPSRPDGSAPLAKPAGAALSAVYCFWFVCVYLMDAAEDPVLWRCAPGALAVAAAACAFFHAAGFHFGVRRPRRTLFFLQLAAFLCIGVIFDGRSVLFTAMLAVTAVMCLLLELLFVHNLKER